MVDFKKENSESKKELFSVAEELESLADEMRSAFNCKSKEKDFRRSKMPLHKTVSLYIINNVMQQFNAIRILCREGYGQPALIILRSMLESLISIKYIIWEAPIADMRAARFEEYQWVDMRKQLKYWKMPEVKNKELAETVLSKEKAVLDNFDKFKAQFNVKNTKELGTWSGVSIEDMARSIGMLDEYNLMYRVCCSFSHPSFLGSLQGVARTEKVTNFMSKPSSSKVVVNLISSVQYFSEFLLVYDSLFELGMSQKIFDYQKKADNIFALAESKEDDSSHS